MEYLIVPNFYAPKSPNYREKFGKEKIHAVSFNRCNFRCEFCGFQKLQKQNSYYDYSMDEFAYKVQSLIPYGLGFKFTGGEPTLNPGLVDSMRCVKAKGGAVLLDSNGSNYNMIKTACDENLIDVLGISLKGITPQNAMKVSAVNNRMLCWDNVIQTIYYAAEKKIIDVIITYVVDSRTNMQDLSDFIELFCDAPSVYFKINNFQKNQITLYTGLDPFPSDKLREWIKNMVDLHENIRGRMILVDGSEGIRNSSGIEVM